MAAKKKTNKKTDTKPVQEPKPEAKPAPEADAEGPQTSATQQEGLIEPAHPTIKFKVHTGLKPEQLEELLEHAANPQKNGQNTDISHITFMPSGAIRCIERTVIFDKR